MRNNIITIGQNEYETITIKNDIALLSEHKNDGWKIAKTLEHGYKLVKRI